MAVYNGGHSCEKRGAPCEPERDEITVAFVALLHERTETDEKLEVRYEVARDVEEMNLCSVASSSLPSAVPNTSSLLGT